MKNHLQFLIIFFLLISACTQDGNFPPVTEVSKTNKTEFVRTLESEIDNNKNQIYCSTLLFAWHKLRKESNGKIKVDPTSKQLQEINKSNSFENSLLENELDNSVEVGNDYITFKSEFKKSLPFALEFENDYIGLDFGGKSVESFGTSGFNEKLSAQFQILYYESDKSFGVKLKPEDKNHEILLITSPQINGTTLTELLKAADRILNKNSEKKNNAKNAWRWQFTKNDVLSIPVVKFNLEENYKSLIGKKVWIRGDEFQIDVALQRIALVLDRKGAEIESEADITTVTEEDEDSPKPKRLIFSKPFLLIFKRTNSSHPYLVAWITNNELMSGNEKK